MMSSNAGVDEQAPLGGKGLLAESGTKLRTN